MELVIFTDGAARGNPGPASYGCVIKTKKGVILHQEGGRIGISTNNTAEYTAVLRALEYVKKNYSRESILNIEIRSDSQLITNQLSGNYRVKKEHLRDIYTKIKNLERGLGCVIYKNIPRAENFTADKLANNALDHKP